MAATGSLASQGDGFRMFLVIFAMISLTTPEGRSNSLSLTPQPRTIKKLDAPVVHIEPWNHESQHAFPGFPPEMDMAWLIMDGITWNLGLSQCCILSEQIKYNECIMHIVTVQAKL